MTFYWKRSIINMYEDGYITYFLCRFVAVKGGIFMGYASSRCTLDEIQEDLQEKLQSVRVICDMDLSEDDYKYLATKVKMLFQFANDMNIVDDYKLAIVVYWVFAMVYWDKTQLSKCEMDVMFEGIPQYKKNYYLKVCMETFDEYGIYKFNDQYKDEIHQSLAVIARHANVPDDEKKQTFETIAKYLESNLVEQITESIMMELPPKTQTIFCYFDDMTKQKVILNIRNLMIRCREQNDSKEELFRQNPYISNKLIEACIDWVEQDLECKEKELS